MSKYNAKDFVDRISAKIPNLRPCPFCGRQEYTTTDKFANILISESIEGLNLGPQVPAGMLICTNCGHIDFFALGSLGMLSKENKEESNDGK